MLFACCFYFTTYINLCAMIEKAFYSFLICLIVIYLSVTISRILNDKGSTNIDLPEEINQIKQGDTLRVSKIENNKIYLEYYNKRNR